MSKKYRALVDITWPDSDSLAIVKKAGGLSKLSPEQLAKVKMKTCKAGKTSDELIESSTKWLLKQGLIEEVDGVAKKKATHKTSEEH